MKIVAVVAMAAVLLTGCGWMGTAHVQGSGWRLSHADGSLTLESSVAAADSRHAWALGRKNRHWWSSDIVPTALSWDGTSWRAVGLPAEAAGGPVGVAAAGPDDAWAAVTGDDGHPALALHWDGKRWRTDRSFPGMWSMDAMTVAGPGDVWLAGTGPAAGAASTARPGTPPRRSVVWHRTASGWSRTDVPFLIGDLAARSTDDVWATASRSGGSILAHFDGRQWQIAPGTPTLTGTWPSDFSGLALDRDGLWINAEADGSRRQDVLHYSPGGGWRTEDVTKSVGRWSDGVRPVPDGSGGLWLVGSTDFNGEHSALAHRTAAGVWTRRPIHPTATLGALALVPGTARLIAAGTFDGHGGVLTYG